MANIWEKAISILLQLYFKKNFNQFCGSHLSSFTDRATMLLADFLASLWSGILAGTLNFGHSYLITTVFVLHQQLDDFGSVAFILGEQNW